jgi:hypothetical protein
MTIMKVRAVTPKAVSNAPQFARALRREWYGSHPGECDRQPGEHREVHVKRDPFKSAHVENGGPVVVLQVAELPLNGGTPPVEVAPTLRLAGDERVLPAGPDPDGRGASEGARARPREGRSTVG